MAKDPDIELRETLARSLRNAGLSVVQNGVINGLGTDLVAETSDGRIVAITVKGSEPNRKEQTLSARMVKLVTDTTDADHAFFVYRNMDKSQPERGLVRMDEAVDIIRSALEKEKSTRRHRASKAEAADKIVFAAMPFAARYLDVYMVAMRHAAEAAGLALKRVDREQFGGDVLQKTQELIRDSAAVISDLSESKPNVLYETGFAHALGRPTVLICSTPLEKLPFNVRNWSVIEYRSGQTYELRRPLAKRLKGVLNG